MAEALGPICLAIDTASDVAGVALFEEGSLLAETTWRTRQSHSRQLLPALSSLLALLGRDKGELGSIVACLGPGSYAGMRVGLSTGKALAYAMAIPLVGIDRLAADALPVAEATLARVVAIQAAGRAELAYAAYRVEGERLEELVAPGLGPVPAVIESLQAGDIVTGEIERLDAASVAAIEAGGARLLAPVAPRAIALGRLGLRRLALGEADDPDTLVPLYLRAPAIGPQPPR